ncbi:MAG: deoxyribose-phosphate aldolase [Spirochaetaceae bacterium]|jgi:deoxyribose-phosphate aldolase|nr:deoxyribose-phosphate aldolase [Spirochaetaceae bacterium]
MTDEMKQQILSRVDHTALKAFTTWADIEKLCNEAIKYKTASVCIPPCYIKRIKEKFGTELKICTVIGFPLGYNTTETKAFETKNALENGADEIDVVINICDVKNGEFEKIETELALLRGIVKDKILKIIIETCYLDHNEKIKLCQIVSKTGADFIKTSTGFGTAGAVAEDIALFKKHIGEETRIKASGGMKTAEDHLTFFNAGADRLGSSSAISAFYPSVS